MMEHEHDGGSNASENNLNHPPKRQDEVVPASFSDANGDTGARGGAFFTKAKQSFSRESLHALAKKLHWP